jgi:outer membrane receptor protein involved in Fe transport
LRLLQPKIPNLWAKVQISPDSRYTRLSDTFIMDAGLKYTYANRLTLALDCENLLDTDHFLAGPSYYMYAYHERGRNLMVSASYTF